MTLMRELPGRIDGASPARTWEVREAIGVSKMEISSKVDIREHRHCAVWDSPYQIDGQALV